MDYLNLILAGYSDENSREHLADYFYKEFKNAEQKYFSSELFFGGCLKEVESFENYIKRKYNEQKSGLYNLQSLGSDEGKEFARTELETINLNDFPIPLNPYTGGRYNGHLLYSQIQYIKKSITESKIKIQLESEKAKLNKISETLNTILENEKKNRLTGFTCNLHPETVKDIYIFMADKNYLSGELKDFQAIFSKVSISVENPVKWQIFNERGIKTGRGNQTALFVFLEMMLGTVTNTDLKKCKDLFIDKKGKFIEKDLLRPDKDKISTFGFETHLKAILKKADQLKNQ